MRSRAGGIAAAGERGLAQGASRQRANEVSRRGHRGSGRTRSIALPCCRVGHGHRADRGRAGAADRARDARAHRPRALPHRVLLRARGPRGAGRRDGAGVDAPTEPGVERSRALGHHAVSPGGRAACVGSGAERALGRGCVHRACSARAAGHRDLGARGDARHAGVALDGPRGRVASGDRRRLQVAGRRVGAKLRGPAAVARPPRSAKNGRGFEHPGGGRSARRRDGRSARRRDGRSGRFRARPTRCGRCCMREGSW
jgi:hypothetical protein